MIKVICETWNHNDLSINMYNMLVKHMFISNQIISLYQITHTITTLQTKHHIDDWKVYDTPWYYTCLKLKTYWTVMYTF